MVFHTEWQRQANDNGAASSRLSISFLPWTIEVTILIYFAIIWGQGITSLQKTIVICTKSDHNNKEGTDNNLHKQNLTLQFGINWLNINHLLFVTWNTVLDDESLKSGLDGCCPLTYFGWEVFLRSITLSQHPTFTLFNTIKWGCKAAQ